MVGQGNFPGLRIASSPNQSDVRNGVVGAAKRALSEKGCMLPKSTCDGVDLGGFQSFLQTQRREDGGQALGQHGFSCSRRSNHNYIVASCSGNLHGTFDVFLSLHIRKVKFGRIYALVKNLSCIGYERFDLDVPLQKVRSLI